MRHAVSVKQGLAAHPQIADPDPRIETAQSGNAICWRVFDAAAPDHVRMHYAYAAGRVSVPADAAYPKVLTAAEREARQKAQRALDEIRPVLDVQRRALALDDEQRRTLAIASEYGSASNVVGPHADALVSAGLIRPVRGRLAEYAITALGRKVAAWSTR